MLGAPIGFGLGVVLAHSRLLQRGFLPEHRRLADDPDPRCGADGRRLVRRAGLPGLVLVSIIAAFLTFFPVTINTLRGLTAVDSMGPRADALLCGRHPEHPLKRGSRPRPYLFAAFKIAATACVVGAIIGELPASIQDGLGGAILNFNQYYSTNPEYFKRRPDRRRLGIVFFLVVVLVEKIVVRRAPEHVA